MVSVEKINQVSLKIDTNNKKVDVLRVKLQEQNVSRVKAIRDNVIFKYTKKVYYSIGKEKITNPFGRKIFVYNYNKERTILDLIKDKDRVDMGIFSKAIKLYFGTE